MAVSSARVSTSTNGGSSGLTATSASVPSSGGISNSGFSMPSNGHSSQGITTSIGHSSSASSANPSLSVTPVKGSGSVNHSGGINSIISLIRGAFEAEPKMVIDKRTIEKTWKLMDKGTLCLLTLSVSVGIVCVCVCWHCLCLWLLAFTCSSFLRLYSCEIVSASKDAVEEFTTLHTGYLA